MSNLKYTTLNLDQKLEVVKMFESKASVKAIRQRFKCGKTQVYNIIRNKQQIQNEWLASDGSRSRKRKSVYEKVDELVYEWFITAKMNSLPISGPILKEQAKKVAAEYDLRDFKASNGWLDSFKSRHQISWRGGSEKGKNDDDGCVKEKISRLVANYEDKDIYHCAEMCLFFRKVPRETLLAQEISIGGGSSKEKLTVLLCCNMEGHFEKPVVVGKTLNPQCFKCSDFTTLPIFWRANSTCCVTLGILEEFLASFNEVMKYQNRQVILFLDNTKWQTKITLSNIKLICLPPNFVGNAQPLNQGVVQIIKYQYRKYLLQSLVDVSTKICSVTVLDAITWLNKCINNIPSTVVRNSFVKAGFKENCENNFDVFNEIPENEKFLLEPSEEFEEEEEMDDPLYTSNSNISSTKEESFSAPEMPQIKIEPIQDEESNVKKECEVRDFHSAIKSLKSVEQFLLSLNDTECFFKIYHIRNELEEKAIQYDANCSKQRLITDFFDTTDRMSS